MSATYPMEEPTKVRVIRKQPTSADHEHVRDVWEFENEWQSGLCGCCEDCRTCCCAFCCWGWFMAELLTKIHEDKCVMCCVPNHLLVLRMKIRAVFRIKGTMMNDCCTVCCCAFCAGVQVANEIRHQEENRKHGEDS